LRQRRRWKSDTGIGRSECKSTIVIVAVHLPRRFARITAGICFFCSIYSVICGIQIHLGRIIKWYRTLVARPRNGSTDYCELPSIRINAISISRSYYVIKRIIGIRTLRRVLTFASYALYLRL
jgi:hypothetical protein